ncbi:MAG: hypothetical protein Q4G36_08285 [Paracoccus sp. (in: a-proteobacteria)]|nr:hypothetical protein [Paracoccus sp. (in: a-proteobacteria)]
MSGTNPQNHMTRRGVIAASAVVAALPVSAQLVAQETPCMALYRDWADLVDRWDAAARAGDDDLDAAPFVATQHDILTALLSAPSQDARDTLAKIMAATWGDFDLIEVAGTAGLAAEALAHLGHRPRTLVEMAEARDNSRNFASSDFHLSSTQTKAEVQNA